MLSLAAGEYEAQFMHLLPCPFSKPMRNRRPHRLLFRVTCEGLRLLAILIAGFICACLFLAPFGNPVQIEGLIRTAIPFFLKLTACLLSLTAIAGIFESLE